MTSDLAFKENISMHFFRTKIFWHYNMIAVISLSVLFTISQLHRSSTYQLLTFIFFLNFNYFLSDIEFKKKASNFKTECVSGICVEPLWILYLMDANFRNLRKKKSGYCASGFGGLLDDYNLTASLDSAVS